MKITHFVLDVDGVLNTGHFIYGVEGKMFKVFGPHDKDGLKLLDPHMKIHFVTADKTGFDITRARIINDWGYSPDNLSLVVEGARLQWLQNNFDVNTTAYMGDGYHDAPLIKVARIGITPCSGRIECKEVADYITVSPAGSGAVLDAALYILSKINV
jgi:3-deoxy-D-manno-octulosonate 8-phosphate phosphatase KdsC-like HAD superfamily phosphatase